MERARCRNCRSPDSKFGTAAGATEVRILLRPLPESQSSICESNAWVYGAKPVKALLIGAANLQVQKSTTMSLWYHCAHHEFWVLQTTKTDMRNGDFEMRNLDEV